jgi:cellulose synthase/poly-beta-1,6-N-acetylglucosamine synthase-like glycosyltransferase
VQRTVSIVIPCYNQGQYLVGSIESCLAQTYQDYQIIVVDDGSTDDTRAIAARYPQVIYLYQPNQGPAAARNKGWRHVRSRYVQFLDADDLLMPTKIKRCVEVLDQFPETDLVVVDSTYEHYEYQDGSEIGADNTYPPAEPAENFSLEHLLSSLSSLYSIDSPLLRYEALEKVGGFNEKVRAAEDWLFWVALAAYGITARHIREALVWVRKTPDSLSRQSLQMAFGRLEAHEQLGQLPIPPGLIDLEKRIADRHYVLGLRLWENQQQAEGRMHFRQVIALDSRMRLAAWLTIALSYLISFETADRLLLAATRLKHGQLDES